MKWRKKHPTKVTLPFLLHIHIRYIRHSCNCVWDLSVRCVRVPMETHYTYKYFATRSLVCDITNMFDHDFCIIIQKKYFFINQNTKRSLTYLLRALSWPSVSSLGFVTFFHYVILVQYIFVQVLKNKHNKKNNNRI